MRRRSRAAWTGPPACVSRPRTTQETTLRRFQSARQPRGAVAASGAAWKSNVCDASLGLKRWKPSSGKLSCQRRRHANAAKESSQMKPTSLVSKNALISRQTRIQNKYKHRRLQSSSTINPVSEAAPIGWFYVSLKGHMAPLSP